jgi:citrate lyase beta subunit
MSVATTLPHKKLSKALERVQKDQAEVAVLYPGESGARQPIHTVYGGAHLFKSDTAKKLGELALRSLDFAPEPGLFADVIGVRGELANKVYARVRDKLEREAVEDFRIDFEDGYGNRPDEEEDNHAVSAAQQVATGLAQGTLPPFLGIRIKPLTRELAARSLRTLDIFLTELLDKANGKLPENFIITLPKILSKGDVETLVDVLDVFEDRAGLDAGALQIEFMVETQQTIFDANGRVALPRLHRAANGRLRGAHFGTYDYTANMDITAAHQRMRHPACDFAKHVMKVVFAGTGVMLSDGATVIMPVAPHRAPAGGALSDEQSPGEPGRRSTPRGGCTPSRRPPLARPTASTRAGTSTRRSCPTRYGAVYGFFLAGRGARRPSGSRTSSTRRRRPRWSATCSTTPPPARACSTTSCAGSRAAR